MPLHGIAPATGWPKLNKRLKRHAFCIKPIYGTNRCLAAKARLDFQKRTAHALEEERPVLPKYRDDCFDRQLDLIPARLVVIDESGLSTKTSRPRGRAHPHICGITTSAISYRREARFEAIFGELEPTQSDTSEDSMLYGIWHA